MPNLSKTAAGVRGKYFGKVDLKRTPTYHEGANDERTAILAKIKRMKMDTELGKEVLNRLQDWIYQRNERYKKNPGGL